MVAGAASVSAVTELTLGKQTGVRGEGEVERWVKKGRR